MATLNPRLVEAVDAYLASHSGVDRSTVIDEALWLWVEQQQMRAMEEQFADSDAPKNEMEAWRAIRRAAAARLMRASERE